MMHFQDLSPGSIAPQWRSKGGQVGARAPGRSLGGASTHFFSLLKSIFQQKFIPKFA